MMSDCQLIGLGLCLADLYNLFFLQEHTYEWGLARKYPYIRKVLAFLEKYLKRPSVEKNSGVIAVNLDGKPVERYYDPKLTFVTTGIKIGEHLYLGNLAKNFIIRLNLTQYPAIASSSPT